MLGSALAALTAQRLAADSGIPACSLTARLARADHVDPVTARAAGLPSRAILVLDEAGMVGPADRPPARVRPPSARSGAARRGPRPAARDRGCGLFRHLSAPAARPAELDGN